MTTNYDDIVDKYHQASKENPLKEHIEAFTLRQVAGEVRAKSVLDLACGDGYYTRLFKREGAGRVVGVDRSPGMISMARTIEAEAPLGLEYQVQDVSRLSQIGYFDLATAVYLLPYASTKKILTAMSQTIYANLRSGGKLVAIVSNPELVAEDLAIYEPYGLAMTTVGALRDGSMIDTLITAGGVSFDLSTYFWQKDTYETILRGVGFQNLTWHPIQVSPACLDDFGADYWQALLAKPYSIVLAGIK